MPTLADLDEPPPRRARGLLVGVAISLPVCAGLLFVALPRIYGAVHGGAGDLDERLRQRDALAQAACSDGARAGSEALCACVAAVEVPSLDCREPLDRWILARQRDACARPEVRGAALAFCACVEEVGRRVATAETPSVAEGYERCEGLDDALGLPTP